MCVCMHACAFVCVCVFRPLELIIVFVGVHKGSDRFMGSLLDRSLSVIVPHSVAHDSEK